MSDPDDIQIILSDAGLVADVLADAFERKSLKIRGRTMERRFLLHCRKN